MKIYFFVRSITFLLLFLELFLYNKYKARNTMKKRKNSKNKPVIGLFDTLKYFSPKGSFKSVKIVGRLQKLNFWKVSV